MKVIIAGSRGITDGALIAKAVQESGFEVTEVVCGGARGVDEEGMKWALEKGLDVHFMPADWSLGKGAGFIRNEAMAEYGEGLIALWDGESSGTQHMIRVALEKGLPTKIFIVREEN